MGQLSDTSSTTSELSAKAGTSIRAGGNTTLASILLANLPSSGAAVLINITVAMYAKVATGSSLLAAAAIVVAYLPPLLVSARLGALIDKGFGRRSILIAELLTAASTIYCGAAVALGFPLVLVLLGVAVRSILTAAVRNSLARWLKLSSAKEVQEGRMQLFILTILLALPLSGTAMAVAQVISAEAGVRVTLLGLGLHLVALFAMSTLPSQPPSEQHDDAAKSQSADVGMYQTVREILSNRTLGPYFIACLFAQPVFQAAEQVLVSVKGTALAETGSAQMQTVGGLGLLLGFGSLCAIQRWFGIRLGSALAFSAVGLGCLLVAAQADSLGTALSAFLGMTLIYELLDTYFFGRFFHLAPPFSVARYSLTVNTIGGTLMGVSALALGLTFDAIGFSYGSVVFTTGAILYGLALIALLKVSSSRS